MNHRHLTTRRPYTWIVVIFVLIALAGGGMSAHIGVWETEPCNRKGCKGIIKLEPVEGCSCHINPPCSACVDQVAFCPECDWLSCDEVIERINDHVCRVDPKTDVIQSYRLRELNPAKIDWHSFSHTYSSMIKEGVYPEGTSMADLIKAIDGTFGGRFDYHYKPHDGKPGRFKYIAYTD